MRKIEILSPAGDFEKLKMAINFGADAVYLSAKAFGLRAYAGNFDNEELEKAVELAHSKGVKVYQTMNILAHNADLAGMPEQIKFSQQVGVDAIIAADAGVVSLIKQHAPDMPIHLSTQASITNWQGAKFWHDLGVKRIVLARELSLQEIKEIRENTPSTLEIEAFVHGAMCVSYSGRCILSNYMTGRDANKGACAHPCRYSYSVVEEQRPGVYMPVEQDERGTYIFNSRDLCMIEHIPELVEAGIDSFKIEGRIKSAYYTASVTAAYKRALSDYLKDPESYTFNPEYLSELSKASHRKFYTGFYFGRPTAEGQVYDTSAYERDYSFCGIVREYDSETGIATVEQRNKFVKGQEIEVLRPDGTWFKHTVDYLTDKDGVEIDSAPHPQQIIHMRFDQEVCENCLLRRKD